MKWMLVNDAVFKTCNVQNSLRKFVFIKKPFKNHEFEFSTRRKCFSFQFNFLSAFFSVFFW